jgi:hypothetical protein
LFIIFDKILPDNKDEVEKIWEIHLDRLSGLDDIGKSNLKNEMLAHEIRDSKEPYVWYEKDIYETMQKLGFVNSKIVMRNDRDVVFASEK